MFEPVFITHRSKRMLRLDYTDLTRQELIEAFAEASAVIRAAPPHSLRLLTVLRTRMSIDVVEAAKAHARLNGPFVRATAVIGSSFWNVVVTIIQVQGRSDISLFEDERAALNWLAGF